MRKKSKVLVVLLVLTFITFTSGLTYSFFHSNSTLKSNNNNIAKLIFNTELLDKIELPLVDLKPGFSEVYDFAITNSQDDKTSDVTLDYQLVIRTFQLVPLRIYLYKIEVEDEEEKEELIIDCNSSASRDNETNEVICNTEVMSLIHSNENQDKYKIKVEFPKEFNDEIYSNLVDYINIEAKSWQKVGSSEQ